MKLNAFVRRKGDLKSQSMEGNEQLRGEPVVFPILGANRIILLGTALDFLFFGQLSRRWSCWQRRSGLRHRGKEDYDCESRAGDRSAEFVPEGSRFVARNCRETKSLARQRRRSNEHP